MRAARMAPVARIDCITRVDCPTRSAPERSAYDVFGLCRPHVVFVQMQKNPTSYYKCSNPPGLTCILKYLGGQANLACIFNTSARHSPAFAPSVAGFPPFCDAAIPPANQRIGPPPLRPPNIPSVAAGIV